jgi:hypothetical protein
LEGKSVTNKDRIKSAKNYLIIGIALFLFGILDNRISDFIYNLNNDIQIYGWGWIPHLIGGILVIYGFFILLEEYPTMGRQYQSGMLRPPVYPYPPPYYPPPQMPHKSTPIPPPSGKIKSCKHCHRPLEPNWIVCPFCGEFMSDKN